MGHTLQGHKDCLQVSAIGTDSSLVPPTVAHDTGPTVVVNRVNIIYLF